MKVLVTGYSGLLGRFIARTLKLQGHYVKALLHRTAVPRREAEREVNEVLWGSAENTAVVEAALDGVDSVVHCAWTFNQSAPSRPTNNERAAELLFRQAIRSRIERFALISSVAVYGMRSSAKVIRESVDLSPSSGQLFIYPSEKIAIESNLRSIDRGDMRLGIFRSGPIFHDRKSPAKRLIKLGPKTAGIALGSGHNQMPFIHCQDVADAVANWLRHATNDIYNVTPTLSMRYSEWVRAWGNSDGRSVVPLFLPSAVAYAGAFASTTAARLRGKSNRSDVEYALACATRDCIYSNEALKATGWTDRETSRVQTSRVR